MDLTELSVTVAGLVGQGAAQSLGEQAMRGIVTRIRGIFSGDKRAIASLEEATSSGDEAAVEELASALLWYARRDAEFASDLEHWASTHSTVTQRVRAGRDAFTAGHDQTVNVHNTDSGE